MMEKNSITRLVIVLSSLVLTIIWRPILIFIIPGILILFLPAFKKIALITLIAYILGISMAFWICSFWYLQFIPLSLTNFFLSITLITILITFYCLFKRVKPFQISLNFYNFILIFLFLLVLGLRLLPMTRSITAAGSDMGFHTYVTQLIIRANGFPDNYYPPLGTDKFNTEPVGFHTISALISLTSDIPSFRSTFIMTCLIYVFITLFLFIFLRRFVSWEFAFISSISFSFFTINPQNFSAWGGNSTIFALALFILSISFLDEIKDNNKWLILFSAISSASVLLSHSVIFIQSFYIFGVSFLIYALLKKGYKDYKWIKYLLIIIFFFIIIIPYLITFDYGGYVIPKLDLIKSWVRDTDHVWHGTIFNFVWTIPVYIKIYVFGKFNPFQYSLFISAIGLFFLFAKDLKRAIQYTTFLILIILLILNAKYWVLPFSYAIYPERAATMAIIPLSLFFAYALETPFKYFKNNELYNKKILSIMIIGLIIFIMILAPVANNIFYLRNLRKYCLVTEADLKAFAWLEKHTNKTDVIQNNYGDAGLWIPSIICRPVTRMHGSKLKCSEEPRYVYIGKKSVYGDPLKNSDFKNNDEYELVYSKDGVYIYRILK